MPHRMRMSPDGESGRILILGASSYIGRHVYEALGPQWADGTFNTGNTGAPPFEGAMHFDLATMSLFDIIPEASPYTHALVLIGIAKPDLCFQDPEGSSFINVTRMKTLMQELWQCGITPVFASTESVFDGVRGGYTEQDDPSPVLEYGRQKAAMERYLRDSAQPCIVARIGRVFGSTPGDATLFTSWVEAMLQGRDITCAYDNRFTPVHVSEVAKGFISLIRKNLHGVYHLCGSESGDRCSLLQKLIMVYNNIAAPYTGTVIKKSMKEFPLPEARPLDISMSNARLLKDTGVTLQSLERWYVEIVNACIRSVKVV